MKILILVLSYEDNGIYNEFLKTQKYTWDSFNVDGIETFYYFGNSDKCYIKGNHIYTDVKESLMNCTKKTIKCFESIKDFEFDYIFRTNSSSYVDKNLLKNFILDKPKTKFYSGIIGNFLNQKFCSGSGYFLSKDLVLFLIENQNKLNNDLIDDVSISKVLEMLNVELVNSERFDVYDSNNINPNYFHYRLKTQNRIYDINNMKKIMELKCNL
jgi:hypothetical protein